MARIRTIKPEMFTDPDLARCALGARWLFAGMFTEADDKGRLIDSPKRLAGAIFPHEDKVTAGKVKAWIDELAGIDSVRRYVAEGQHLLWLPHFNDHQKISHPTASRLPAHPDELPPDSGAAPENDQSGSGADLGSGSGSGSRNEEVELGTPNADASAARLHDLRCFDEFWHAYPRRVAKGEAQRAWKTALKHAPAETIIERARNYAHDPNLPQEKFVPHPATWLNGQRWDDPPEPSPLRAVANGTAVQVHAADAGSLSILANLKGDRR